MAGSNLFNRAAWSSLWAVFCFFAFPPHVFSFFVVRVMAEWEFQCLSFLNWRSWRIFLFFRLFLFCRFGVILRVWLLFPAVQALCGFLHPFAGVCGFFRRFACFCGCCPNCFRLRNLRGLALVFSPVV